VRSRLVFICFLSFSLQAQEAERLDFEGFYQKALVHSSRIRESQDQLAYSEIRERVSRQLRLPQVQWNLLAGPSPSYSGNALSSQTSYDSWGVALQSQLEIIQPLYTFGSLSKLREAARLAHEAELGRHDREKALLQEEIAKLYYGYQLAFELRELSKSLLEQLRNAQSEGQKMRRNKTKGAPTLTDLDRLEVYIAELEARFDEAQKYMDLARMGMALEVGMYGELEPRWRRANLRRVEKDLLDLPAYQEMARQTRPEFAALRKEIEARELMAEAEHSKNYPALFAGARWTWAKNSESENQPSVFARDPYNENSVVAGVGLRWNLFSPEQRAKSSLARAEAIKVRGKNQNLLMMLDADLEKKWLELRFLRGAVEQRERAETAARKVYRDMLGGFTLGTRPAKDLLESMGALALAQKSRLETVFEEHLAWTRLESLLGDRR
jgi:outer membrane protein TolC